MKNLTKKILARLGLCPLHRAVEAEQQLEAFAPAMQKISAALIRLQKLFFDQNETLGVTDRERLLGLKREEYLRAQLMNVRVQQSGGDRTGWEVMCYIPQATLRGVRAKSQEDQARFVAHVAYKLVEAAVRGIFHVDSMGKVNALVFAPLDMDKPAAAPKHVQVLFEKKDGEFDMSNPIKLIEPESEETRLRRML
jgi:hypothetical protein